GQRPAQSGRQRILSGRASVSASRAHAERSSLSSTRYGVRNSSESGLVASYSVDWIGRSSTASARQRKHGPCRRAGKARPKTQPVVARLIESSASTLAGTGK